MLLNESSKKAGEMQFSPVFCGLRNIKTPDCK